MSQKYIKTQNKNSFNQKSYGKYYAQPVYDQKFIETPISSRHRPR